MAPETGSRGVGMPAPFKRPERVDLGDGIILRWSTQDDTENIADCMAEAFRWVPVIEPRKEEDEPKPNELAREGMRRLMRGNSGVMSYYDYAIAVNTLAKEGQNPVVACVCLQASPGYYGKVPILYGKPECVGSHPDFRNKGLVRRLFLDLIHPASESRGDVIQIVPGISHFYRQFGYEYAMDWNTAYMIDNLFTLFPQLDPSTSLALPENEREPEPFTLRVPSLDDIPYLVNMSTREKRQSRAGLGLEYFDGYWKYTIHDVIQTQQAKYDAKRTTRIIVDAKTGRDCGLIVVELVKRLKLHIFTLEDGYHYRDAVFSVLRQMIAFINQPTRWELKEKEEKEAKEKAQREEEGEKEDKKNEEEKPKPKVQSIAIDLDHQHPVAKLLSHQITPKIRPYKLYTRIQSYAKFILTVRPELEDRLAKSCLAGITVTWQFDFFRKVLGSTGRGLEVVFKEGKIISASDDWVPLTPHATMMAARERIAKAKAEGRPDKKPLVYTAEFAPLTFTRLLVGDMSIEEMIRYYGECSVVSGGDDAELMLDILFPKQLCHFDTFWW
ncbi:MAG: hypothetical protein J3Q66DRAFT_440849 [Benniella sp.]|nr:MAG: hypothetical protein J3Q66DRAFT_440849 [Benniella sp.]